mmetsp:Transcript_1482/g.3251  ORF Transcript_1482/g.3251 Transcript_1482/m.3251 type:complete len:563 (-) Transcript_1482:307-1995(-)|eukprot:CAMPEP_0202901438 /NCGR_PEP_ID=MMETSP1392-20130828/14252_1 /ASSEMBLY_ACC=CAM_ASM_000868 /TAXON_ID=225041 /ORGANISM="Chlamydomonas chlamydogama, Strain SAG 11-48b" /LENGTH=562 /DNA_ID=CAMNT_0049587995 /DNA_START=336 /DNA_END=2024 /DNA_ORIENTATION=-
MGQAQSSEALDAVNAVEKQLKTPGEGGSKGIKLFKFVKAGTGGNWELASANARPSFYDALEDTSSSGSKHDWFMEVEGGDIDVHVDQDLGYVLDLSQRRVTFSAEGTVWALRFPSEEQYRSFGEELNNKVYYNTYGMENSEESRTKELGADYAGMFFNAANAEQAVAPMDLEPEPEEPTTPAHLKERRAKEDAGGEEDSILGLIMGAGENNYLMRGGTKFDVLRNVEGGVEDKCVSFTLTPAGKGAAHFTPSKVLLAQGERRMNLLTPDNTNALHHADVETGKIVSTWKFQKDTVDVPIRDIVHEHKSAQMEEVSTFLGLDNNRLCKWDLRDPRGKVAESPIVNYTGGKDYSRGTNFTCMATSGDGYVVVGSQDGKVRLFSSKSLNRATTSIPGLGAPITSVDVTFDGKWVVATTDHYLMVVKTTFTTDKGEAACAFTKAMGGRGTMPRLLRLKPEDVARTGNKPFRKGKLTWVTESGHSERWIVASCGKYSVVWNFAKVKTSSAGSLSFGGLPTMMDYVLSSKDEDVVDAAFVHQKYALRTPGKDAALVVATPHSLFNLGG